MRIPKKSESLGYYFNKSEVQKSDLGNARGAQKGRCSTHAK